MSYNKFRFTKPKIEAIKKLNASEMEILYYIIVSNYTLGRNVTKQDIKDSLKYSDMKLNRVLKSLCQNCILKETANDYPFGDYDKEEPSVLNISSPFLLSFMWTLDKYELHIYLNLLLRSNKGKVFVDEDVAVEIALHRGGFFDNYNYMRYQKDIMSLIRKGFLSPIIDGYKIFDGKGEVVSVNI